MGMGFARTWLRQVSPPLLHKTTVTTGMNSSNLLSDALCVDDNVTERVYSYKLLGIVIQRNLKWHDHVDLICAKASSRLHFRSLQTICCIFTLLKKCPVFGYAYPAWHTSLTKEQTKQIEVIQKRALRIIFNSNCID